MKRAISSLFHNRIFQISSVALISLAIGISVAAGSAPQADDKPLNGSNNNSSSEQQSSLPPTSSDTSVNGSPKASTPSTVKSSNTTVPSSNTYVAPTYTPTPVPSCDEAMKATYLSIHNQQLAAEEAKHNVAQASIDAMPAFTALQIANKYNAQTNENNRHTTALNGIESAYQQALLLIHC